MRSVSLDNMWITVISHGVWLLFLVIFSTFPVFTFWGQSLSYCPAVRSKLRVFAFCGLSQNSKLRLQLIEEEMNGSTVTVYRCGDSIAVCSGPLLPHTGLLKVFKMLQVCLCNWSLLFLPSCGFYILLSRFLTLYYTTAPTLTLCISRILIQF